jgi:hypothetical protein
MRCESVDRNNITSGGYMTPEEEFNETERTSAVKQELIKSLRKREWVGLNWGDMPIGQVNNLDFMEGARWAEKWLKERNA